MTQRWRKDYGTHGPHSVLGGLAPENLKPTWENERPQEGAWAHLPSGPEKGAGHYLLQYS
jgi:hypothetical protein